MDILWSHCGHVNHMVVPRVGCCLSGVRVEMQVWQVVALQEPQMMTCPCLAPQVPH